MHVAHRKLLLLHLQVLHRRAGLLCGSYRGVRGLLASLGHLVHRRLVSVSSSQHEDRDEKTRVVRKKVGGILGWTENYCLKAGRETMTS